MTTSASAATNTDDDSYEVSKKSGVSRVGSIEASCEREGNRYLGNHGWSNGQDASGETGTGIERRELRLWTYLGIYACDAYKTIGC